MALESEIRATLTLEVPLDLGLTLGPLYRGPRDPTMRLHARHAVRAWRSPHGAVTLEVERDGDRLVAKAWGPGAEAAIAGLPALLGLDDDPSAFRPAHPLLVELARRLQGLRLGRTDAVLDALLPAIVEQKVAEPEARASLRHLEGPLGEPAPGPHGLRLMPPPERLAALPSWTYHQAGLEARRAATLRRVAHRAEWLEATRLLPLEVAYRRLLSIPGIGPWTAAEVASRALGDPDAVSVGDFHLPSVVAWALAGEARADDARMLELLEPYRGQRARVIRLLEASEMRVPRFGPRLPLRSISST